MAFNPVTATVSGRTDVDFTPDLATNRVVIRLWPNGGLRDATAPVATLTNPTIGGLAVATTRVNPTTMVLKPPTGLAAAKTVTVSYDWSVRARGERKDRVSVSKQGKNITAARFGSFIPILAWEPGVGWNLTPPTTGGAEASMHPAADWDVTVNSGGFAILASGDRVDNADGSVAYSSTAQRDWAMSLGEFRLANAKVELGSGVSVAVTVGVANSLPATESASRYLTRVTAAIRDQSRRYGTYPWSTYTLAITPGLAGGIEYPSHVMQGPKSLGRTTPHEVAHQWFYALVGNDQGRDPWLDEGLATWVEARTEGTVSAFAAKDIPVVGRNRLGESMTFWDANRAAYYRSVYVQTVRMFNDLGSSEMVDCVLAKYSAQYAYDVAVPGDLVDTFSKSFPNAKQVFTKYGVRIST